MTQIHSNLLHHKDSGMFPSSAAFCYDSLFESGMKLLHCFSFCVNQPGAKLLSEVLAYVFQLYFLRNRSSVLFSNECWLC